ncbi:hypothetical protein CYLTODRAFT_455519 [Cylindrobasidium torrendii FP15055 ss-10]|uniref:Prokaryotic-type class I peptide chain release factors domain-containing protein n=1 Tax=Cylindrobasidium torrendii FP15055 ss-10 TaxID=1314674 RepID=A0A0D7B6X3_9AGAR|nr:hypothetical protein CYLTODRAFT_455519 [Cylindrobasidium torrendii FP15055 ss-10]
MSLLNGAARSAYRQLYRASRATFGGDEPVLLAFRNKMREDVSALKVADSPNALSEYAENTISIAQFLRKNIIQGVRDTEDEERWRLRLTKDTELGDNDSIKAPPPLPESSRQARRRARAEKDGQQNPVDAALPNTKEPQRRMNFSVLKKVHKQRIIPQLNEADLEEAFVRGRGPGGQAINKTESNVQLLHKPTGIRIECQYTRSLEQNRKLARRALLEKLDQLYNPGLSKENFKQARQQERERRKRKKQKKKAKAQEEQQDASDD